MNANERGVIERASVHVRLCVRVQKARACVRLIFLCESMCEFKVRMCECVSESVSVRVSETLC